MPFRTRWHRTLARFFSPDKVPVWLLAAAAIGVGVIVTTIVLRETANTQAGYEQYKWRDTKYADIRSRIVTRNTSSVVSTIEYPVTTHGKINETIAAVLDRYNRSFDAYVSSHRTRVPFEQNSSYEVVRHTNKYLSILVSTSRDYHHGQPERETAYWTFDRETGQPLTLSDLFGTQATDGIARVNLYVRQEIARQSARHPVGYDMSRVNTLLTDEYYKSFLAPTNTTLRFDFSPGEIADASLGTITVTLPIDNLQLFMQTSTARGLFDIMSVGAPNSPRVQAHPGSPDCQQLKCIALTFDDGPSTHTSGLLDTLMANNAHASFFLIGQNIARYPSIVQRQHLEGHTIGNHSWDHTRLTRLNQTQVAREITLTNDQIKRTAGTTPTYVRPPNGAINRSVISTFERLNMTSVLWSVDTRDWADRNTDIIYNRVVANAKPGSIVILHDVHKTSVNAVSRIIKTLQKEGYTFVSLDEMFGPNPAPGKIISRASQ